MNLPAPSDEEIASMIAAMPYATYRTGDGSYRHIGIDQIRVGTEGRDWEERRGEIIEEARD